MNTWKDYDAAEFKGKTLTAVAITGHRECDPADIDQIDFTFADGKRFRMHHSQNCCESVCVHDMSGDLQALVGSPLTVAKQETSEEWPADVKPLQYNESFTWTTFYFETDASKVRLRWLGQSNGYYGEGVDINEIG